ncbi:hypothetical protein RchiOBHm_Chr4g0434421 [Rosa chinensis]|uniref:Transmembrane protein n=1 Tax=Rosa chinensis TaxID=74649 RepID=A0A2P6R1H6_ROSCH|nr:hypothetical protein RchiOBHm_Chr4g0434421 [Rosa chinensis]
MARILKDLASGSGESLSSAVYLFWAALVTLVLVSTIIFSCSDGMPKDEKTSTTHTDTYGTACAAGGCGGACGA